MSFGENIKNSFKILGLNTQAAATVADDNKSTGYGFLTLILAGVAMAISSLNPFGLILNPIVLIIGFFIGYSIYHFLAKFLLGGQATGTQYFRAFSNSFVVYWITFIPVIGVFLQFLAGLWLMVVNIFILHSVHKLSMVKAIILGLLFPVIVILILLFTGGFAYFGVLNPTL